MKRLLFFIPILFIGCTSLGPKFDALQSAIKDRAVIYVYRPTAFTGSLRSPDIIFNGKKEVLQLVCASQMQFQIKN